MACHIHVNKRRTNGSVSRMRSQTQALVKHIFVIHVFPLFKNLKTFVGQLQSKLGSLCLLPTLLRNNDKLIANSRRLIEKDKSMSISLSRKSTLKH